MPALQGRSRAVLVSIFRIKITACNPKHEEQVTAPLEALVDTGSDLTWLPGEMLWRIGLRPRHVSSIATAKGMAKRQVGYAILRANGYEIADEVVFAEAGDPIVIGVRTLESFGVPMDSLTHRFVDIETLAEFCRHSIPDPSAHARLKTNAPSFSKAA
jgi:predicted aspartyl protease